MKLAMLQLPIVARELTELAQRKSTYRLRCFAVGISLFISIIYLTIIQAQAESVFDLIGSGYMLHMILYVALLCVLYVLAPAMCCSAITTEKEKQTLGLLLISRISPFSLVLEKICSRMIPLLSLVLGSAPVFGVAFLLGGVTVIDTVTAIVCLTYVALQVTTVAVVASAVMKSSIAAFWSTYLALIAMYFGAPLLAEVGVLPYPGPASMRDNWLFLFPPYQADLLGEEWAFGLTLTSNFDLLWITIPSLFLTTSFFLVGWLAVSWMGDIGGLTFRGMLNQVQPIHWIKTVLRIGRRQASAFSDDQSAAVSTSSVATALQKTDQVSSNATFTDDYAWRSYEAAFRPIFWRERLAMPLLRKRYLSTALMLLAVTYIGVVRNARSLNYVEEAALLTLGSLVIALLLMVSLATRIFTRERDQQTLESLLVLPLSNNEILKEKMGPLQIAVWWLLSPIMLVTCLSLFQSSLAKYHDGRFVYFTCMLSHGVLYLHLVKWISLYFGLRMKSNMKAMVASLGTIVLLCVGPIAISVTTMISLGSTPDDGMFWFYSSPVIVPMLGAFRDLHELYERNSMPNSGLVVIFINLSIYFGVMSVVKKQTLKQLPKLLNRRDQTDSVSYASRHIT